ncbi:hypothetical protein FBU30_000473, partial [Linnemannia zychae]
QIRILFGYIARVVPDLEELEICLPYLSHIDYQDPKHYLRLGGGLCLLGRLKSLQRLRVFEVDGSISSISRRVQELDLNCMVPSGRCKKFKELRQAEIMSWKDRWAEEDRSSQVSRNISRYDDIHIDFEIRKQLGDLRLLEDVIETINEIDGGHLLPFPSLFGLSFYYPTLKWPEEMLEELFPKRNLFDMLRLQ